MLLVRKMKIKTVHSSANAISLFNVHMHGVAWIEISVMVTFTVYLSFLSKIVQTFKIISDQVDANNLQVLYDLSMSYTRILHRSTSSNLKFCYN
jgi:hypothetical protein